MDLSEIRAYVREFLDLTTTDLSDGLINRWVNEGGRQVLKSRPRWVHLEARKQITTVIGQQEYDITPNLRVVSAADCTVTGPMAIMDEAEAVAAYYRGTADIRRGRPESLTRWTPGKIKIWPLPDQAYIVNLLGQRPYVDAGPTDTLDLPSPLIDVVLDYVMAKAYLHGEDTITAQLYFKLFEQSIVRYVDDEDDVADGSMIFGGGPWQARRLPPLNFDPRGPGIGQFGNF